jgi:hypothetical protein
MRDCACEHASTLRGKASRLRQSFVNEDPRVAILRA